MGGTVAVVGVVGVVPVCRPTRAATRPGRVVARRPARLVVGVVGVVIVMRFLRAHHQRNKRRQEPKQDIHNGKRKARLQHRAVFGNVDARVCAALTAVVAKDAEVDVDRTQVEGRARYGGDVSEHHHARDEAADEEEIDKGDEVSRPLRRFVPEERREGPDGSEDGDDEEGEDEVGSELVVAGVPVYEPGEHSDDGDECDQLREPDHGEED